MKAKEGGFTIVELLIVVVIVAILAAITVVAYNGIKDRSTSSALQSDLSNAKRKLLMYQVDNGQLPTSVVELTNAGVKATKSAYDITGNNFYYCINRNTHRFAVGARTVGSKGSYLIVSDGSLLQVGGVSGDTVCQAVGLTGWADANGFISNGHSSGIGWLGWVGN